MAVAGSRRGKRRALRQTGAVEVAVAVRVIGTPDRRPVLVRAQPSNGIGREFARISVPPLVRGHHVGGMLRRRERIVAADEPAVLPRADFLAYGDHGIDEAIE